MTELRGLEELTKLRDIIDQEVQRQIDTKLKTWRRLLYAFSAGATLFIAGGLLRKEDIFKPIVETIYPPSIAFTSLKPSIGGLGLKELPNIDSGIAPRVIETMEDASEEQYRRILKSGLYSALHAEFHGEMTGIFGTAASPNRIWAATVEQWGMNQVPAIATIVDPKHDGEQTACGKKFSNDQKEAILVIPSQATASDYRWFGCGTNYPLRTELRISTESRDADEIRLVGVERGGRNPLLEIRLSQAAAKALQLVGASDFTVNRTIRVGVSKSID